MKTLWMTGLAAISWMTLLATPAWPGDAAAKDEYRETIEQSLTLKAAGSFALSNRNGAIEFTTWDKEEVHIVAEKRLRPDAQGLTWLSRLIGLKTEDAVSDEEARTLFAELKVEFTGDENSRTVTTRYPAAQGVSCEVSYRVTAPRRVSARIETVNGSLRISGVEGETTLRTTSGNVKAADVRGTVHAESTNGRLDLDGIDGSVEAETTNGSVRVSTVPDVAISGSISLASVNGSVHLAVPSQSSMNLDMRTVNGSVGCDLSLSTTRESSRRRLVGIVGTGGPTVTLRTTNGSVRVVSSD